MSQSKIILSGEHSVVYGYPAVVASTSLGVDTSISPNSLSKLKLKSLNLQSEKIFSREELSDYLSFAKESWEKFNQGDSQALTAIKQRESLSVLALAAAVFLEKYPKIDLGFDLSINSQIPVGSGMGSSAAVSAAVIEALAGSNKLSLEKKQLSELVFKVEQFIHGRPSGVDNTAIVFGGLLKFQKQGTWFTHTQVNRQTSLPTSLIIQSGIPEESTGEMVSFVAEQRRTNSQIDEVLSDIGQTTKSIIQALKESKPISQHITQNQQLLETLGVIGKRACSMIRIIEQHGGAAKICGAGGVNVGSGVIWAIHPEIEKLITLAQSQRWKYWQVSLGETSIIDE